MQLVYATGERERDFQAAGRREDVPAGARVYATCTRESTAEEVGETTFRSMTDEEFYSLRAKVREARERASAERPDEGGVAYSLRNILGDLFRR